MFITITDNHHRNKIHINKANIISFTEVKDKDIFSYSTITCVDNIEYYCTETAEEINKLILSR